jgi:hypothetical protein
MISYNGKRKLWPIWWHLIACCRVAIGSLRLLDLGVFSKTLSITSMA